MKNAWQRAEAMAEEQSGGIFVRLSNDGDSVIGVFVGEPSPREVIWTGEGYVDADTPEGKRLVESGERKIFRVAMNFYVPAEQAMKVFEMTGSTFKTQLKLRKKYGLDSWAFEIERQGAKGDPKTKYSMLPDRQLTDTARAGIAAIALNDLDKVIAKATEDTSGKEPLDSLPF